MKFNLVGSQCTIKELVQIAPLAQELGFDGIVLSDHVVMHADIKSPAPHNAAGKSPMGLATAWVDPWVAIGAMAAVTETLRFTTSIYILPLRHPLQVAKSAFTAAEMSDGRFVLGVGVGWIREEFEAMDADFGTRGRRTEEAIEILRKLQDPAGAAHDGTYYRFPHVSVLPSPPSPLPVYVGGDSERALRRAALLGDGYLSGVRPSSVLVDMARHLRKTRRDAQIYAPFEFVGISADASKAEDFSALADEGVDALCVLPWSSSTYGQSVPLGRKLDAMRDFAREVMRVNETA